ncbi:hypothetical protein PN466_09220 [Roseofilum reptotaenium CS-1145]|uniref:hypothetical protein n=1 Tax=Roseofilum reptotaenium TaxID=1233427 RepID=UPI00232EE3CB|nr:hypothetical protein [Roseofilum reptotaenium]MDB9517126.1 hypothetical protein [Roseofilum reptotaenium CS-1145]
MDIGLWGRKIFRPYGWEMRENCFNIEQFFEFFELLGEGFAPVAFGGGFGFVVFLVGGVPVVEPAF